MDQRRGSTHRKKNLFPVKQPLVPQLRQLINVWYFQNFEQPLLNWANFDKVQKIKFKIFFENS